MMSLIVEYKVCKNTLNHAGKCNLSQYRYYKLYFFSGGGPSVPHRFTEDICNSIPNSLDSTLVISLLFVSKCDV